MKFWMGLVLGVLSGAGISAWATVACGTFDTTILEVTEVRKDGLVQPLPADRQASVMSQFGLGYLYQPELGRVTTVSLRPQP